MNIFKNPQIYQTIFLMVILNLGINIFWLYFDYTKFFIVFGSCIVLDALFLRMRYNIWKFPFSGINAGFWISFFLRTDELILYFLAAFLAISSKYIFTVRWKHFLNPSNFWAFIVLAFFPLITWNNPLQWWKIHTLWEPYYIGLVVLILVFASILIWRVYAWIKVNLLFLIIPFVGTHFFLYSTTSEWSTLSLLTFYTPAFLIFTFHMLTDPVILPKNNFSKALFGINVAIGFYILQYFINENYSLLASLFLNTLSLPVERILSEKTYKKINIGFVSMILLAIILICIYCILFFQVGVPDFVFGNRCKSLVCD